MSERHASVYLLTRAASAVINAAAVAISTRITSQALYGQYLIGFAIGFIVFSLAVQWATQAHFGNYAKQGADRLAGSLLVIGSIATVVAVLIIAGLAQFGVLHADIAWACAVLIACFTTFFAATEIGRTHLMVGVVTVATLTRSAASLILGAAALLYFQTPAALLIGVGLGYAIGAVPVFVKLGQTIWTDGFVWPARRELAVMFRYGWPLIIAFGASAAAMNIDRILLERFSDAASVAPYGAVLDFMKQTFLVVAEAISVGYVSYAKNLHTDGDVVGSGELLKRALVTQCYLVAFGTVFFVLLGGPLFSVLLPASYLPVAMQILPILLVANALLVLRSYHFGQVIYLGVSSTLEFASSIAMLVVASGACFVLIPSYGVVGAAIAFTLSQAAALGVYLVATPKAARLPIDWPAAGILAVASLGLILIGQAINAGTGHTLAIGLNFALLALSSAYFLIHWNLFEARGILDRVLARFSAPVSEL